MFKWFRQLDTVLRGDATQIQSLRQGDIDISVIGISLVTLLLAIVYGLCMGSFAMIRTAGAAYMQFIAAAVKLPLLFFLTLLITFPSLYVFNALVGSRLTVRSALRLLVAVLGVMLAVIASLGPIVVFFSISTTSYPFMVLLNVIMCSIGGFLGLTFLLRTLHRLIVVQDPLDAKPAAKPDIPPAIVPQETSPLHASTPPVPGLPRPASALDKVGQTHQKAKTVFQIWVVVFALVGAQLSWVLRPFIGNPDAPFEWFRARESNFFMAVLQTIHQLFSN